MADFSRLTGDGPTGSDWIDRGGGKVPFGVLALDDPFTVAALRQRAAAVGGRREGKATAALDALGTAAYDAGARPSRIWNALLGLQPGEALSDHPEIVDQGAALGLDLVGAPGLTGGVPLAALGSGAGRMSRNGLVENAAAFKQRALEARNEGTGSTVRAYDSQGAIDRAQGGSPAKDSFEREAQKARAGWESAKADAQDDFLRAVYPERYPEVVTPRTNESLADIFSRYRSGDDFMLGANATDGKTGAAVVAANEGNGIRAYHGSPHDFDRFDLSKIGTGEGAQSFGHGLYFAENPKVAESYKKDVSMMLHRNNPGWSPVQEEAATRFYAAGQDHAAALKDITDRIADSRMYGDSPASLRQLTEAKDLLASGWKPPSGKMYEVNINANPEHFLDWDKPLHEQSEPVRSAYQKITGGPDPVVAEKTVRELDRKMMELATDRDFATNRMRNEAEWHRLARDRDAAWEQWSAAQSGEKFYRNIPQVSYSIRDGAADKWRASEATSYDDALRMAGGDKSRVLEVRTPGKEIAAARLREAGVPGIRYLDQGSRGAGEGSRNYVLFNDSLVDILRKYALPGAAVPFSALAGSDGKQ